jgi:ribosomal protein S27AE
MARYKEGDKSRGICGKCKKIVDTTFRYDTLKLDSYDIKNILQGFCDECGDVISIPHQSSYKIGKALKKD